MTSECQSVREEEFPYELGKLIPDLTYEQYAAAGKSVNAFRSSMIQTAMNKSMEHLKWEIDNPKPPSEAMKLGSLVHEMLRYGLHFKDLVRVMPVFSGKTQDGKDSTRSKAALEAKAAWLAEQPDDAIIVTEDQARRATAMTTNLLKHPKVGPLLHTATKEHSLFIRDPETDITHQCKPDAIARSGYMIDIKTARSAAQSDFVHCIFSKTNWFYIAQAAHYTHCARLSGLNGDSFTFVAVESDGTFGVNWFPVDIGMMDVGEQARKWAAKRYAECVRSGIWPGYSPNPTMLIIPEYCKYQESPGVEQ